MHPHQSLVLEGVAVGIGEGAFGCGADVGEDQVRACFGRQAFEVFAIPGWERRGEDARVWAEFWVCVKAYPKAVTIHGAAVVLIKVIGWSSWDGRL